MRDIIDVRGASGASYRFKRFRDGAPLSAMGGNFLYARQTDEGWALVYVGEAQNLLTDARLRLGEAVERHGAVDLFTRLNISERVRGAEQDDILRTVRPPMNAPADAA